MFHSMKTTDSKSKLVASFFDILRFPNVHYYANRPTNFSIFPYVMGIFEDKGVFNRRTSGRAFLSSNIIKFLLKSQNVKEVNCPHS